MINGSIYQGALFFAVIFLNIGECFLHIIHLIFPVGVNFK